MEIDRQENLKNIIRTLLDEWKGKIDWKIPEELEQQQLMMRALLNIRPAMPASEAFLQAQDAELQLQLHDKGIVELENKGLLLWQGDITRLRVDAIVNAANSQMLGCFVPLHNCIDNAIHSAAGIQLRLACHELMERQGHDEPTGSAKITDGYNLPAKYVIHTVGPIVENGTPTHEQELQLASCYRSCLRLAEEHQLRSIAFCCISTGVFGFPQQRAAEIAVKTVIEEMKDCRHIDTIVFNVFKDKDYHIYRQILKLV
ncbi:MAG: protein-ADP-ribose hydrolase [Prevotella sp.]|jgi:O-acetyl-ADP-ribose deacetylase (regulator of RNase III)